MAEPMGWLFHTRSQPVLLLHLTERVPTLNILLFSPETEQLSSVISSVLVTFTPDSDLWSLISPIFHVAIGSGFPTLP